MDQTKGSRIAKKLQKDKLLFAINCICGLSIGFFGYDQGLMGGVNNAKDYIDLMGFGYVNGKEDPVITDSLLQVYYLGALCGCLIGGVAGDRIGRTRCISLGAIIGIFGASLQCSSQNHKWMICARWINGIGTGILNNTVPIYATETSEHTSRGAFVAWEFTMNIVGVVIAYWMEYGLSFIDGGNSAFRWRFPIAFQIIPLLILATVVWIWPESPRWLCKVGREKEVRTSYHWLASLTRQAQFILGRLRGEDGEGQAKAEKEFQDIKECAIRENLADKQHSYISMLFGTGEAGKGLHLARRVQLVIWLQIFQEWIGIAGIAIYAPSIFRMAGFSTQKSLWISGLNNIFFLISTLVCVYTLDLIGRRSTLYWGSVGMGVAMALAGGFSRAALNARAAGNDHSANGYGIAAATFVYVYTFVFGATWLTVPWLYPAEIFPLEIRAKGNAYGVVGWSIGNGWLTLVCPVMFSALNERTLYIFAACNFFTIPMVWALYPETNQRTLEEMDLVFAADSPWVWDAEQTFRRLKEEQAQSRNAPTQRSDDEAPITIEGKTNGLHLEETEP